MYRSIFDDVILWWLGSFSNVHSFVIPLRCIGDKPRTPPDISDILQDTDVLEKLEVEKEARLGLEVEKDAKQRWEAKQKLEAEKDVSPNLEAESDLQVRKSLQKIKDVEPDKSAAEGRHQKV